MQMPVDWLVVSIFGWPALVVLILAIHSWFFRPWAETTTIRIVALGFLASLVSCILIVVWLLAQGSTEVRVPLGTWFSTEHYAFEWVFLADRLSVPFAAFSASLVGLIAAFSWRYLHREPGFGRFYMLLALFGAAVQFVVLSGSLDLIFVGWELVGVTSVLLIAFFHERRGPVEHGLRAFITYRLCDVGLLSAAVLLHYWTGSSDIVASTSSPWGGITAPEGWRALLLGLLVLWASMGKAAQAPLSGWLPRAMEGPTPSSAVFYGALSIHLGPYLLLRAMPIIQASPLVVAAVIAVGAFTALHATFVGRTQTDIKSALAYASVAQVGLIYVEIGLGLEYLALTHIVGHATIRTLEILKSPSLLHDHHHLEQAMGRQLPRTGGHLERLVPEDLQPRLYRLALERGGFDAFLEDRVIRNVLKPLRALDRLDRAWFDRLSRPKGDERAQTAERSKEVLS